MMEDPMEAVLCYLDELSGRSDDEDTPPAASCHIDEASPPVTCHIDEDTPPAASCHMDEATPPARCHLDEDTPPAASCHMDEATPPAARRRHLDDTVSEATDLQDTLTLLSAEFGKGIMAKRRRLEKFTSDVTLANQSRVSRLWRRQQEDSDRLVHAVTSQMTSVADDWGKEVARMKHIQEKIGKIVTRQLKNTQGSCDVMEQRMRSLQGAYSGFMERRAELQAMSREEIVTMRRNLDTEVAGLQKKMVSDIHKEDIDNMKKTFKTVTCL